MADTIQGGPVDSLAVDNGLCPGQTSESLSSDITAGPCGSNGTDPTTLGGDTLVDSPASEHGPTTATINLEAAGVDHLDPTIAATPAEIVAAAAAQAAAATAAGQASTKAKRASLQAGDGYVSRVGFDTLGCDDSAEYAFTLQVKTDNWKRTRRTRTFLVGTDLNDYSAHALQWLMENLVEDGDEIVALRVVPMVLRDSLSKSRIPSFQGQESAARTEANKIMKSIREKNPDKEISIVVECMVGNVKETIQQMIKMYKPEMLVVGTRGRSPVKGFLLGSVSRYCLHHSSIPVVVVRPARKLNKSKQKTKGIFRRRSSGFLAYPSDGKEANVLNNHWGVEDGGGSSGAVSLSSGQQSPATSFLGSSAPSSPLTQQRRGSTLGIPQSSTFDNGSSGSGNVSSSSSHSSKKQDGVIKMSKSWTIDGGSNNSRSSGGGISGLASGISNMFSGGFGKSLSSNSLSSPNLSSSASVGSASKKSKRMSFGGSK